MSWSANQVNQSHVTPSYPNTESTTPKSSTSIGNASGTSVSPILEPLTDFQDFGDHSLGTKANSQNISEPNKERVTVPSACVPCRSKHLKCDGNSPCSRCLANHFECVYVRSRRGFKGPRRNGTQSRNAPTSNPSTAQNCPMVTPLSSRKSSSTSPGIRTPTETLPYSLPQVLDLSLFDASQDLSSLPAEQVPIDMSLSERCLESYFIHFHPAHPIVVPRHHFLRMRRERHVAHLEAAMKFAGSFFAPHAPTTALGEDAERLLYREDCPRDAFRVQALLIMCVAFDGSTNQDKALSVLLEAQTQAISTGMNRREFALLHAGGSSVVAESFRRTWWELFVIDGMIAGVHQRSTFRMKDVTADVVLPCEEHEYFSGVIPASQTWEDYENDGFDGKNTTFSSYTYRIAAMRNMGHVLAAGLMVVPDEEVIDRLDARLVNWRLHLPDAKRDFINPEGKLDEMLFQAHMITEATTVLLHREHSQLDSAVASSITACAPYKEITSGDSFNTHAAKTIKAAQAISKLIQLPVPLVKHTHFFTCVVTLASIVHLMCWGAMLPLTYDDDLKQQLRLSTGSLKTLRQVWPAAGKAFGQVKGVAQDMFAAKKQALEAGLWNALTDEEIMKSLIEDQGVLNELQLLT